VGVGLEESVVVVGEGRMMSPSLGDAGRVIVNPESLGVELFDEA